MRARPRTPSCAAAAAACCFYGCVVPAAVPLVTVPTDTLGEVLPVGAAPLDAVLAVVGVVAAVPVVIGVMVTPPTLPVIFAFCCLLVVSRALRVAAAFASAAARASVDKGFGDFLGSISNRIGLSVPLNRPC